MPIAKKITQAGNKARQVSLLSPIRTITVGPGITPDLLTSNPLLRDRLSARGLSP